MDIKKLQENVNARWRKQENNPCYQSDTQQYMILHMTKALGKIASALNDSEHENSKIKSEDVSKYLADLVICAAQFSNDIVDLDEACLNRLEEKFPQ